MKYVVYFLLFFVSFSIKGQDFSSLAVGKNAKDFTLKTADKKGVQFSKLSQKGNVVLIVLRGWPEYQCPICTRQVGQFLSVADEFQHNKTSVVFVYPGPAENVLAKSKEFSKDFDFPDGFYFVLDPDYSMVNSYGLRWDAKKETAYPSTFVVNRKGEIIFSKISTSHGGRAKVNEVLELIEKYN